MSLITADFESYYAKGYSLTSMTYEQYIRSDLFTVHGVGIKIDDGPTKYYKNAGDLRIVLASIFYPGNDHILVGHNTYFDGAILSWYYGLRAATYYCTQCMSNAIWPQYSASLKALAERLWPHDETMRKGVELEDFKGVRYLDDAQQEIIGEYCIQDVDLTFEAFKTMWAFFPADELETIDWTLKCFIHPVLQVDRPRLEKYIVEETARKKAIIKASGISASVLKSSKKFCEMLEEEHGIEIPLVPSPTKKNPDNMKRATAKDDLEYIEIQVNHPELQHIWDGRAEATSSIGLTRAVRILEHSETGPYNPEGLFAVYLKYYAAHTGRWGGGNKTNVQNFKRKSDHRLALLAPPGYVMGIADLSNIEMRMLSWFVKQQWVLEALKQGRDIYSEFATQIYGRPVDRKRKVIDPETGEETSPDFIEGFVGKTCVLGLGYGMGWSKLKDTFAKGALGGPKLFFTEPEARHFVNVYRTQNDRVTAGWRDLERVIFDMCCPGLEPYAYGPLIIEYRRIRLPNGLYLTFPELDLVETDAEDPRDRSYFQYWDGEYYKKLYGGLLMENIIQALARIVLNWQRQQVEKYLKKKYPDDPKVRVVMSVHDEMISILPKETAEEDFKVIISIMRTMPDWCNDGSLVLDAEGGIDVCYSK